MDSWIPSVEIKLFWWFFIWVIWFNCVILRRSLKIFENSFLKNVRINLIWIAIVCLRTYFLNANKADSHWLLVRINLFATSLPISPKKRVFGVWNTTAWGFILTWNVVRTKNMIFFQNIKPRPNHMLMIFGVLCCFCPLGLLGSYYHFRAHSAHEKDTYFVK